MKKLKKEKNAADGATYLAAKKDKSFTEEIAKITSIEGFCAIMDRLPNPDIVLRKTGKGYTTLRLLMQEGQVATCIQSRKAATQRLKYRLNFPELDEEREKFYTTILKKLDFPQLVSDILNAPLLGFQAIEIVWGYCDGYIIPQQVEAKPQEWFFFDTDKKLRIRLKGYSKGYVVEQESKKFLIPKYNADYLNPYGLALLSLCFWDVAFKKGGMQFWMKFIEKFAVPYFIGKYEEGASDEEKDEILEMLIQMVQDAVAVIPNNSAVEIKEATGKSQSAEIFQSFIEIMDKNIAKNILGQTLTTEAGDKGSYALGKVHNNVREDISDSDKRLTENTINTLLYWTHEFNFGDENIPEIELYEPKPITQEDAGIDKTAYDMGVRFSAEHFIRKYGYKADEITVINLQQIQDADLRTDGVERVRRARHEVSKSKAQRTTVQSGKQIQDNFSEPDTQGVEQQQNIDDFIDSFSDDDLTEIINEKLKPIIEEFSESRNADEAMDKLSEIYPQMNSKQLEETLTKAIFIADLWGRCQSQRVSG